MSVRDGLVVALPEQGEPLWMRVVDGVVTQSGEGANWLAACGLTALPADMVVMLVPPAALVTLHWAHYPELAPRQGRAAARLAALASGIVPADQLFAAANENDDPAAAHIVAVAARSDMQHWLLWAQHHGLDPDIIVPAPLLLPEPAEGVARGMLGGEVLLRGEDVAFSGDLAPILPADAVVEHVTPDQLEERVIAALLSPPLDMRQGDFAKRVRRATDKRTFGRILLWSALVLLVSLLITLIAVVRQHVAASNLDTQSLALARQVVPNAGDLDLAEAEIERQLAARCAGAYAFTAPVAALLGALQDTPGVSLTALSRDPDGMIRATLAAAKVEEINSILLALQGAGFTITATPSQDPGGRALADITVRS
ncbi:MULTISPECIES: type II secretion system protein GspL [Sphingobium]|uniref:type II secretion system protein GspL n=1 Tax=Sphingobium sp. MI1205 TaxID=407020 RepID=UPI00077008BA|nr:type II secretion system protein GspL [Sphingobium sp. MI1205]AMK18492.1 type II secretory pathway component PulL [Sphingobium sp. MI1205]